MLTAQPSAAAAPANLPKPIKEAQATHPLYNESIIRPASMMLQPRILFVAEVSLAQCAKYRVWQKVEYFRKMGVDCTVLEWWRRDEIRNALQTHSLAIFYRTPGYPESLKLIAEARRLNVPTIWEVDDLIFDEQTYRANGNIDLLEPSLRDSVLAGVPLFRAALQACDYAIASTETLATEMVRAGAKEAFVIENALDTQTLIAAQVARSNRQVREEYSGVRIVYGSGSKAHDADFQTAAKALAKLMTVNQDVELHIIGDLTLPGAFDVFANRVVRRPFVDYETYLLQLAEADISLAPLEPTIFNDAKSNIKYLEAAVLGLPSVCSPRAAFRAEIEHGVNGFLAESEADWLSALTQLVVDKNLRAQVGSEALQ
ncbi:glycosyltransferase, partial [Pseudanabaenaceae cyanobacterium LEGE 13415]|nr:glycosyltransferase [Pseudanabaenaceae cyanobacterium LEGE 13415]